MQARNLAKSLRAAQLRDAEANAYIGASAPLRCDSALCHHSTSRHHVSSPRQALDSLAKLMAVANALRTAVSRNQTALKRPETPCGRQLCPPPFRPLQTGIREDCHLVKSGKARKKGTWQAGCQGSHSMRTEAEAGRRVSILFLGLKICKPPSLILC